MPGGVVRRDDAQCPGCDSLERHRLLWLYLQQRTDLFQRRQRLLHVAPPRITQGAFRKVPTLDYVSLDLYSPIAMVRGDLTTLPFSSASFDVILCSHVLEHVLDDRAALEEMLRVLKPGGWAVLQVPFDPALETTYEDASIVSPEDRFRVFGQDDHVRICGLDYADRIREVGFQLEQDPYVEELEGSERELYGLPEEEDIWIGHRPS